MADRAQVPPAPRIGMLDGAKLDPDVVRYLRSLEAWSRDVEVVIRELRRRLAELEQ